MKFDLVLLIRIFVGSLLGCVIGGEREARGSAAGDRTFGLVSLGAAAFTAAGVEHFTATAEKVMAGIVTGVGCRHDLPRWRHDAGSDERRSPVGRGSRRHACWDRRIPHCRPNYGAHPPDPGRAVPPGFAPGGCPVVAAKGWRAWGGMNSPALHGWAHLAAEGVVQQDLGADQNQQRPAGRFRDAPQFGAD
jgi:MgtC family